MIVGALSLGLVMLGGAATVTWYRSVELKNELDDARWLVKVLRHPTGDTETPQKLSAPDDNRRSADRKPFAADTLIPLERGWIGSAIFTVVGTGERSRVTCHVRLRNSGKDPVSPRLEVQLFDRDGALLGSADRSPPLLLPGEQRADTFPIDSKQGAAPAWFAIRALGSGDKAAAAEPAPQSAQPSDEAQSERLARRADG